MRTLPPQSKKNCNTIFKMRTSGSNFNNVTKSNFQLDIDLNYGQR